MTKIHVVKYDVEQYGGWSSYFLLRAFSTKHEASQFIQEVRAGKLDVKMKPGEEDRQCSKPVYLGELDISQWTSRKLPFGATLLITVVAIVLASLFT